MSGLLKSIVTKSRCDYETVWIHVDGWWLDVEITYCVKQYNGA